MPVDTDLLNCLAKSKQTSAIVSDGDPVGRESVVLRYSCEEEAFSMTASYKFYSTNEKYICIYQVYGKNGAVDPDAIDLAAGFTEEISFFSQLLIRLFSFRSTN